MMIDGFFHALQYFVNPWFLFWIFAGILSGIIVGIVPGIGGMVGITLFLPFAFVLPPEYGITFMVALHATSCIGGSITAVLLGIPGDAVNTATIIDGFPMTQKGEGGRGLGNALMAAAMGGLFSVLLALVMIPLVMPLIFAISSADMVFVILMGFSFVIALSQGSMIKGLISAGLGVLISLIGFQTMTGIPRFAFGSLYLYEGITVVPICLGLFALPETIFIATEGDTIADVKTALVGFKSVVEGIKDVFRHWWLFIRIAIIGYIVGVIPGIGGMTSVFAGYAHAKQTSKHPEKFGTGIPEGVMAPEGANNAKEAGDLLTTLALGIPGGAGMTVLLAALLMKGVIPGPKMIKEQLDLALSFILVVGFSKVIAAGVCLLLAPKLAKIAFIRLRLIIPEVILIIFIGCMAFREVFADLIVMLIFCVIGVGMKSFGYNRPALLLGYILGSLFEQYLFMGFGIGGPLFFLRPVSLVLILIIILTFSYDYVKSATRRWTRRGKEV